MQNNTLNRVRQSEPTLALVWLILEREINDFLAVQNGLSIAEAKAIWGVFRTSPLRLRHGWVYMGLDRWDWHWRQEIMFSAGRENLWVAAVGLNIHLSILGHGYTASGIRWNDMTDLRSPHFGCLEGKRRCQLLNAVWVTCNTHLEKSELTCDSYVKRENQINVKCHCKRSQLVRPQVARFKVA